MSIRGQARTGFSLLLLVLVLCAAVLADDPCRYCKGDKLLKKLHYVDGDKTVCDLCSKKLPKCASINAPSALPSRASS